MRILFVHQNFPAQFRHLALALSRMIGVDVAALAPARHGAAVNLENVPIWRYPILRGNRSGTDPWLLDLDSQLARGQSVAAFGEQLKTRGYHPDVIIAHPGWGETLFLKDIWPSARLGLYCEFFYQARGADVGFDPEFVNHQLNAPGRLRMKNAHTLLSLETADAVVLPTRWQAKGFPSLYQPMITVIHDGVDTSALIPNPEVKIRLPNGDCLSRQNEVLTYVSRHLEPYRGFHIFMRALPDILRQRPTLQVLIVGAEGNGYGEPAPQDKSWKQRFSGEVQPQMSAAEWQRVHFLGALPYEHYLAVLQLSTVHVYLTYPFVLSWSLIEAMSVGCAIVASDTAPVQEVITNDVNGRLVDFFSHDHLADAVLSLFDDPVSRARLGLAARQRAMENYDLKQVCLPRQLRWVDTLAAGGADAALV